MSSSFSRRRAVEDKNQSPVGIDSLCDTWGLNRSLVDAAVWLSKTEVVLGPENK